MVGSPIEQWLLNPDWLTIRIMRDYTSLSILGIRIIQEQGIPINQPGLNGMIEGFISHYSVNPIRDLPTVNGKLHSQYMVSWYSSGPSYTSDGRTKKSPHKNGSCLI